MNTKYNPGGIFTPKAAAAAKRMAKRADQVRDWSVSLQAQNTALDSKYLVTVSGGSAGKVGEMLVVPPPDAKAGSLNITTNHILGLGELLTKAKVDTQDVKAVVEFLKGSLNWSVQKVCPLLSLEKLKLLME